MSTKIEWSGELADFLRTKLKFGDGYRISPGRRVVKSIQIFTPFLYPDNDWVCVFVIGDDASGFIATDFGYAARYGGMTGVTGVTERTCADRQDLPAIIIDTAHACRGYPEKRDWEDDRLSLGNFLRMNMGSRYEIDDLLRGVRVITEAIDARSNTDGSLRRLELFAYEAKDFVLKEDDDDDGFVVSDLGAGVTGKIFRGVSLDEIRLWRDRIERRDVYDFEIVQGFIVMKRVADRRDIPYTINKMAMACSW